MLFHAIQVMLVLLAASVNAQKDTVVFVHGLAGWGPDELLGLGYWGGFGKNTANNQYFNYFRNKGFRVIEASVGPLSSAHDRACELFAQLKCLQVDYGAAHAAFYSQGGGGGVTGTIHQRRGKNYATMGTACPGSGLVWNGANPIHFVGHSFGGNTIRYLEFMLQEGLATESGSDVSELFKPAAQKTGGGNWIRTMTTVATPHDGSTLTTVLGTGLIDVLVDVIGFAAAAADYFGADALYDFDLAHFGLSYSGKFTSKDGFKTYVKTVMGSPIFKNGFKDLISYDLSPIGAQAMNQKGKQTYPNTYYFAISTDMTDRKLGTNGWYSEGHDVPLTIDIVMGPVAKIIGQLDPVVGGNVCQAGLAANSAYGINAGGCFVGNTWEASDGVVPTFSSKCPHVGYPNSKSGYAAPVAWGTSFVPGKWYTKEVRLSHLQVIGTPVLCLSGFGCKPGPMVYEGIANTISKFCTGGSCATSELEDPEIASVEVNQAMEDHMSGVVGNFVFAVIGLAVACAVGLVGVIVLIRKRSQVKETLVRVGSGTWEKVRITSGSFASPLLATNRKSASPDVVDDANTAGPLGMQRADSNLGVQMVTSENPVFASENRVRARTLSVGAKV